MTSAFPSEAIVAFTDYQQFTVVDASDLASIPQATTDNVVAAFLAGSLAYTGLAVGANSDALGVTVAKGCLYNLGGGYPLRTATPVDLSNLINLIPDNVQSQVVLIVASAGTAPTQETRTLEDASQKPTNPADLWPTVQGVVTTRLVRSATPDYVPGAVAVTPQPPAYNPLLCLLATVVINKTGVVSVTQNAAAQITRLDQLAAVVNTLSSQVAAYATQIAGLLSSVSALTLAQQTSTATLQAEITALQQALTALGNKQATQATGSVYTVTDYYTDASGLTVQPTNPGYQVGAGLTFPSTGAQIAIAPTTVSSSRWSIQNGKLIPAFNPSRFLGNEGSYTGGVVAFNSLAAISTAVTMRGFGVERTRYGAAYTAQSVAQLLAGGDPTQLFAVKPTDLPYQAGWDDWRKYSPELAHAAGYWHDLTSRGYWTPQSAGNPVSGLPALIQAVAPQTSYMLAQFVLFVKKGTFGDIRMLVCDDASGAPDFTRVLADVTCPYGFIGPYAPNRALGVAATFTMPYPILQKAGRKYHYVFLCGGDTQVVLSPLAPQPLGGPILAVGANGQIYQYTNQYPEVSSISFAADFTPAAGGSPLLIPLNPLYQGGGIDQVDLLTPAIVPDGCDIRFGLYNQSGAFQEFAAIPAGGSSLLAGRPSSVNVVMELLIGGGSLLAPIIDLGTGTASGTASGNTAKQSGTLSAESPIRTPAVSVTKVTRAVTLQNFNPAIHTYTEQLETGAGFATLTPPTTTGTPLKQADGSYLLTFSWVLGTAVASFKVLMSGTTSDTTQIFTMPQSVTTASP